MGKIAIIGFHNLHLMQFLYKYTNILDEKGIDYDVLYWKRDDTEYKKKFRGNAVCFEFHTSNYVSKWRKIQGYVKCRSFFVKKIRENGYDKLILLTTQTAVALSTIVLNKYKNRYIYDYRDITMENVSVYRRLVEKLVINSSFTSISSKGFVPFINSGNKIEMEKYVMAHNCSNMRYGRYEKKENFPIRIVFWGMVRQIKYQKRICDFFGNDNRFEIHYHGEGATEELRRYCLERKYNNILFTGRYIPEDIVVFAENTDILMNLYENDGKQEYALTVKFYDGIKYGLPMLVMKNSYMDAYIGERAFKYSFSFKEQDKDNIIEWFEKLNEKSMTESIKEIFCDINQDESIFEKYLLRFCEEK